MHSFPPPIISSWHWFPADCFALPAQPSSVGGCHFAEASSCICWASVADSCAAALTALGWAYPKGDCGGPMRLPGTGSGDPSGAGHGCYDGANRRCCCLGRCRWWRDWSCLDFSYWLCAAAGCSGWVCKSKQWFNSISNKIIKIKSQTIIELQEVYRVNWLKLLSQAAASPKEDKPTSTTPNHSECPTYISPRCCMHCLLSYLQE